ncbi:MAG: hypothetical protein GX303_03190 [Clostridiales bacterium]|nr:hypothetical protein [Clostridiales bacterium]
MLNHLITGLLGAAVLFILIVEPPCYSLPLIIAILLHEGGHLLAQRLLCGKRCRIRPVPFGLSITLSNTMISYKRELMICAAGPLANLLAACLSVLLMHSFGLYSDGMLFFLVCNLLLGVVNLLPVKTLDGGRILLCLLLMLTLPHTAERISNGVSMALICLIWVSAVYLWLNIGQNPYLIFLSIYLFALSLNKNCNKQNPIN